MLRDVQFALNEPLVHLLRGDIAEFALPPGLLGQQLFERIIAHLPLSDGRDLWFGALPRFTSLSREERICHGKLLTY